MRNQTLYIEERGEGSRVRVRGEQSEGERGAEGGHSTCSDPPGCCTGCFQLSVFCLADLLLCGVCCQGDTSLYVPFSQRPLRIDHRIRPVEHCLATCRQLCQAEGHVCGCILNETDKTDTQAKRVNAQQQLEQQHWTEQQPEQQHWTVKQP